MLRKGFIEFRAIITPHRDELVPLLPLHIFGIFLNLTYTGEAASLLVRAAASLSWSWSSRSSFC